MNGRAGNPCCGESGLPFIFSATIESSLRASSSGMGAVYPSTQWNITQVASGLTFAISASSLIETPSHCGSLDGPLGDAVGRLDLGLHRELVELVVGVLERRSPPARSP